MNIVRLYYISLSFASLILLLDKGLHTSYYRHSLLTHRQAQKQTDRHTYRHTYRQTNRHMGMHTDRHTTHKDKQIDTHTYRHTGTYLDGKTHGQN